MKSYWFWTIALGIGAMTLAYHAGADDEGEKKVDARVFELRTYHAASGKMDALHARFRDHTCKLFKKHAMTIVGFWSPTKPGEAEKKLIYILAFPSREAANKSWAAFRDDPEWKVVREASEKDGKLASASASSPAHEGPVKQTNPRTESITVRRITHTPKGAGDNVTLGQGLGI